MHFSKDMARRVQFLGEIVVRGVLTLQAGIWARGTTRTARHRAFVVE